ncbi:ComF family protein [Comamonas aquatica]|nr:ComF family protein [Comamonas aquatica]
MQKPAIWQHAHAWMDYSYPCNTLIARWKFAQQPALAAHFARWMRQDPQVINLLETADVLIPIPLSPQRMRERGYNPAAQLARHLSPAQYLPHCLQRTRHTTAQSDLTRAQRLRNLRHAFAVADAQRHRITDRHVLLIDDVMTTGATLTAASHCLLQAGARQIDVLCMARTP